MRTTTHITVRQAPPGRHSDAKRRGLYLIVSADRQNRRWAFRYTKPSTGRVTEVGLGSTTLLTLEEARNKAEDYRRAVARGEDPVEAEREAREAKLIEARQMITFAELASAYIAIKQPGWRSQSHWNTMRLLLNTYARPLAIKFVSTITADDIEAALRPLWNRSAVQGRRTLYAIQQVFDYAEAKGLCMHNPADWKRMKHRFPSRANGVKHFTAMDYEHIPVFMRQLRIAQERNMALSPYAIEFLLLTACRGNEVVGMQWSEVDFGSKIWAVPASRTKANREHRVPLSERALALLVQQSQYRAGGSVWPLTSKTLYRYLTKNMGVRVTIHGFRSSFRDWAGNETGCF